MIKTLILVLLVSLSANAKSLFTIYTEHPIQMSLTLGDLEFELDDHGGPYLHVYAHDRQDLFDRFIFPFQIIEELKEEPLSRESQYFDTTRSYQAMEDLEAQYFDRARVVNLNNLLAIPSTTEGNDLLALQVSDNPDFVEDEPKILIVGQHHARELMTQHAVIDSAKDLLENSLTDPNVDEFLKNHSVWFVPVVNPDGLNHVHQVNKWWRKNRRPNSDGSFGVDLNRNYEFKWGQCGSHSAHGSSDVYKGSSPHSEVETQIMDRLNDLLRAQYVISYHSSGNEVLYPFVCGNMAEKEIYYDVRDRLAQKLKFAKRVASSSGEDFEHHYAKYGSISFLLEIGTSFQPSFLTYQNTVKPRIQKVLPFLMNEIQEPMLWMQVLDSDGNPVQNARVSIDGFNFSEGEEKLTDQFGVLRWRVPPGEYQAEVSHDSGFWTGTLLVSQAVGKETVTLSNFEPLQ